MNELTCYTSALIASRAACSAPSAPVLERFPAAVLFADISGFTPLANGLSRFGPEGAEELNRLLNAYFSPLIEMIYECGGDVLDFAGDALIALWPVAEGRDLALVTEEAARCALGAQARLHDFPIAEGLHLSLRVSLAAGEVLTAQVGGLRAQWELVVAGDPFDQIRAADKHAKVGQVILSPQAWDLIRGRGRAVALDAGCMHLEALGEGGPPRAPATSARPLAGPAEALRPFINPAILHYDDAGQIDWMADLRRVTVLFIKVEGLDLAAADALERLQLTKGVIQGVVHRFEGMERHLIIDDKGTTGVVAFGLPPFSHEDDADRALRAALAIRAELRRAGLRCGIGVSTDRVFCGLLGNSRRRVYTMMGSSVNLAARLMGCAGEDILCDAGTQHAAFGALALQRLPNFVLKGMAAPVPVFRLLERAPEAASDRPLIGRDAEYAGIAARLDALKEGRGGTLLIEGEAGIGKSRLLAETLAAAGAGRIGRLVGATSAIEKNSSYHAWRAILVQLLGLGSSAVPDEKRRLVHERLAALPEAAPLAPLLNAIVPLDLPENDLTAQMTGRVRADNLHHLVVTLLKAEVERFPLVIVLEDVHWLDFDSWPLVLLVRQHVAGALLVLTTRPLEARPSPEFERLREDPATVRVELRPLGPGAVDRLVCDRLGVAALDGALSARLSELAAGNPFFAVELALYFRDSDMIHVAGQVCRASAALSDVPAAAIPNSIRDVITSRIDHLEPARQLVLKTASVIDPVFGLGLLQAIYPVPSESPRLAEHLDVLVVRDLFAAEASVPEPTYRFRHVIIHQIAYSLLLLAHRRQLHRAIAEWYERERERHGPADALLAYHWGKADVVEKEMDYLGKVGDDALRSGANHEAVRALERALAIHTRLLADPAGDQRLQRARWRRRLGEACFRLGNLPEARKQLELALALVGQPAPTTSRGALGGLLAHSLRQLLRRLRPARLPPAGPVDDDDRPDLVAALCLERLSAICYFSTELLIGTERALRALNIAERAGALPAMARGLAGMGLVAGLARFRAIAALYLRRAEEAGRASGHLPTLSYVLMVGAVHRLGAGRWEEVRRAADECVAIAGRLGDQVRLAEGLTIQAMRACYLADYAEAERLFREVEAVGRRNGNVHHQAWGLCGRGECLFRWGQLAAAVGPLEEALRLLAGTDNRTEEVRAHGLLAVVWWRLGRTAPAVQAVETTLRMVSGYACTTASTLEGLAGAAEVSLRRWEQDASRAVPTAVRAACAALDKHAAIFPIGRPRARLYRGQVLWLSGKRKQALACWRRGLAVAGRLALRQEEALLLAEIGGRLERGDPRRTVHLEQAARTFESFGMRHELAAAQSLLG